MIESNNYCVNCGHHLDDHHGGMLLACCWQGCKCQAFVKRWPEKDDG